MKSMKRVGLAIIMALVFCVPVSLASENAGATVASNPSILFRIPCTQNAYIDSNNPTLNYSSLPDYPYIDESWSFGTPNKYSRAYWQFDIASLPGNLIIDKVTGYFFLIDVENLNLSRGWDGFTMGVYSVESSWNENTLTWNTAPTVNFAGDLVQTVALPRLSPSNSYNSTNPYQDFYQYESIDLTLITNAWYTNATANNGVMFSLEYQAYSQDLLLFWNGRNYGNWFPSTPYVEVIAHTKECQVHLSYYNAFTGEGIDPWTFNVSASVNGSAFSRITPDLTTAIFGSNMTVRVFDFFGNELYNGTKTILASAFYWDISISVYSYKFYNQNAQFALLQIYYNMSGTPYSEFIPPNDHVDRYLKNGTYRFNITFYNESGVAGNQYTWVRTIPSSTFPGAGFVILQGTTISEVISNVQGVQALVQVVADLVTPAIIQMGHNLPSIPSWIMSAPQNSIQSNLLCINGNTLSNQTGTSMTFLDPYPLTALSKVTAKDDFSFIGNLSTDVYVNDTNGSTVYHSTTLPATVALSGEEYVISTNRSVAVSREIDWRWFKAFTYQYYADTKLYTTTVEIENALADNWRNVTVFVPFQNTSYVDNSSVSIWDVNNSAYLVEGTHYILTTDGIYMWWPQWNSTLDRAFVVKYFATNTTWNQKPASITINTLGDGSTVTQNFNGKDYYFCLGSWTNTGNLKYDGPLYMKMTLSVSIDPNTIIVETDKGAIVTEAIVAGSTVIIPEIVVDPGNKVGYTILFQSKGSNSLLGVQIANVPVIFILAFILAFTIIVGALLINSKSDVLMAWARIFLGIGVLALIAIVCLFMYFIAVG